MVAGVAPYAGGGDRWLKETETKSGTTTRGTTTHGPAEACARGGIALIVERTHPDDGLEHIRGAFLMPMNDIDPEALAMRGRRRRVRQGRAGDRLGKMARRILEAPARPVAPAEDGSGACKAAGRIRNRTDPGAGTPQGKRES
jgi:hypothetical protein